MRNERNPLRRLAVWLQRLPHRRGYGIHSPFAFQLVTQVIYEDATFCAYAPLAPLRPTANLLEKDDRLLLRLANHLQPHTLLAIGSKAHCSFQYLAAGCRRAQATHLETATPTRLANLLKAHNAPTLLYIDDTDHWPELAATALPLLPPHSAIVIHHIRATRTLSRCWQTLVQDPAADVTFDLYRFGIIFRRPELHRAHYLVNYL